MAESLCCDASYITVLADRLEARGLVNRAPDPDDRRVKRLVLTKRGRKVREELLTAIHETTPALAGLDGRAACGPGSAPSEPRAGAGRVALTRKRRPITADGLTTKGN